MSAPLSDAASELSKRGRLAGSDRAQRDTAMIAAYQAGNSLHAVGRQFGVTHQTVLNVLQARGIARRTSCYQPIAPEALPEATRFALTAAYQRGASLADLARTFHHSLRLVRRVLRAEGIVIRTSGSRVRRYSDEERQRLCESYLAGASMSVVGKRHGVSATTVATVLRERGITSRSRGSRTVVAATA
jgi:transposase-like protein